MKFLFTVVIVFFCLDQSVEAQNQSVEGARVQSRQRTIPTAVSYGETQKLLSTYSGNFFTSSSDKRELLQSIHSRGLEKTPENLASLRQLIASNRDTEEKIILVRILGAQYASEDKTKKNNEILQELRMQANSGNAKLARASLLTFSRLNFFSDTVEILTRAKDKKLIDANEYFGEFAHLAPYAAAPSQRDLINRIRNAKNTYAIEILTSHLLEQELQSRFEPESKSVLESMLQENEPQFSMAIGEFGLMSSIRYSNWLHAVSILEASHKNGSYQDAIWKRINDPQIDPRKIIAFLGSSEGEFFINGVQQRKQFDASLQKISLYVKQLPQNATTQALVQKISTQINSKARV